MSRKNIELILRYEKPTSRQGFSTKVPNGRRYAHVTFEDSGEKVYELVLPLDQIEVLAEMLTIAKEHIIEADKDEVNG